MIKARLMGNLKLSNKSGSPRDQREAGNGWNVTTASPE